VKDILMELAEMRALFLCSIDKFPTGSKKTLAGVIDTCQVCLLTPQKMKSHLIFSPFGYMGTIQKYIAILKTSLI